MRRPMIPGNLLVVSFVFVVSVLFLGGARAASGSAASAAGVRGVIARFDSLLADGSPAALEQARALTTGTARRLFPLLAETRHTLAPARADHARTTRLRLRLARRDGSSFPAVPSTPSQRVLDAVTDSTPPVRDDARDVILEVRRAAVRDSLTSGRPAVRPDSLARYLASTPELDLTDKLLRTRAAQLAEGSPHDVETARRVWRYVSTSFDYKLGATLFATSREALRDLKGDCSEASILTAALLRAAGIPARVMLGYASLGQGVWIGHAWVEAWLGGADGGWVGVDAALREFPTGPHRVALVALSGREDMKAAATNLMLSTLNNLDIEIEGAWAGAREIPLVEHPAARAEARKFLDEVLEGMGR